MRKIFSGFLALAMALPMGFSGGAVAMPQTQLAAPLNVIQVQGGEFGQYGGRWDRTPRDFRRGRGDDRRWDRGWDRGRDRAGYYRGHRGYRDYRPGYRRYNDGFWYPGAAFITGAIIGGAIASQPAPRSRVRDYGSAHVQWCYDRYRSYRASDNSFQPYNGPRRECRSPYY